MRFGDCRTSLQWPLMYPMFVLMIRRLNQTMTSIIINDNDIEGDLSALAATSLMTVGVHNNPKLCGMVPASVRFAHGYNPSGTRLGQPC